MAYTKLFNSLITSTVWREDDPTRIVWITMLALADKNGEVQASVPGLAHLAGATIESTRIAICKFMAPDPDSRTKDDEGRRIEEIDGGWLLLNHAKYRALASKDETITANAIRQQRFRNKRKRNVTHVTHNNAIVTPSNAPVTDDRYIAEAEAEAEAKIKKERESLSSESDSNSDSLAASRNGKLSTLSLEWNRLCNKLPAVRDMSVKRRKKEAARLKEHPLAWWKEIFEAINSSKFLTGGSERGWRADYDWIISDGTNALKVLEGKYSNREQKQDEVDDFTLRAE